MMTAILCSAYLSYLCRLQAVASRNSNIQKEGLDRKDFDLRNCVEEAFMVFANRMEDGDQELAYQAGNSYLSRV